jgi:outer membrane protein assembly factor BamB
MRFDPLILLLLTAWARVHSAADDWPQWRGPNRDGVWRETGLIETFAGPELKPLWRAPISNGYSGPTVAQGRVYVTDRIIEPKQIERVHCFDAKTGQRLWMHEYDCPYRDVSYDDGPRASITVHGGRAYSLGAMGHLFCLNSESGTVVWSRDMNKEYAIEMPVWGIASAPLIEGGLLIVQIGGSDRACVVALDPKTGQEKWRALDDKASYSAPIVIEQAGRRVVVVWTGDNVTGLNPMTGETYWTYPFEQAQMVINIANPVPHGDHLFMTSFFDGSLLLKLDPTKLTVEPVWRRRGESEKDTDALHSIISTPVLDGQSIYGVDSYGELRCLDLLTGDRVWESQQAVPRARWATIHFVRNAGRYWMFNERGELIIAKLSRQGYVEISRAKLIEPTTGQLNQRGGVCWSHPGFANRCVFARNDQELLCATLAAPKATKGMGPTTTEP